MPRLTSNDVPISPYRVIWELDQGLDKANSIVTHDSGNPRDQMVPFYTATTPRGYIGWGNSTQLGTGLGLIMGAKLAAPEKTALNPHFPDRTEFPEHEALWDGANYKTAY